MNPKSRTTEIRLFRKMAAISALERIRNVPMSKNLCKLQQCAKFHAKSITKSTFLLHICPTISCDKSCEGPILCRPSWNRGTLFSLASFLYVMIRATSGDLGSHTQHLLLASTHGTRCNALDNWANEGRSRCKQTMSLISPAVVRWTSCMPRTHLALIKLMIMNMLHSINARL